MRINIIRIPLLSLLVFALFLFLNLNNFAEAGAYKHTIDTGSYEIVDVGDGTQEIKMDGFGQILDPGKPKLPSKIFSIAIPPGQKVDSIEIRGVDRIKLDGTYNITPAPIVMPLNALAAEVASKQADYDEIVSKAYASDRPYPEQPGVFISQGGYRKYNLAQVRFSPFYWAAQSGELCLYSALEVTIYSSFSAAMASATKSLDSEFLAEVEDRAAGFIDNYEDAQAWYSLKVDAATATTGGFVIITTDALESAVWPIKNWEICKGRDVHVETVEDINSAYSGADLAEKIRNFLRANLAGWSIIKVMLIGDITDVPMRYTYPSGPDGPDDDTTNWELEDRVPTDYYYAELTSSDYSSWNSNHDSMYGQQGVDNVQFPSEVDVGRIPWSDPAIVESICMKMAEFEYSSDMDYKLNYLFTGAFFWSDTDNAVVKTYIINNALDTGTYGYPVRIYEQNPSCWDSIYWSDYSLSRYATRNVWGNDYGDGPFGYVNLAGHGSHTGVGFKERHSTCTPEYYFYSPHDCAHLDDSHPSIVFSNACSTAWPEDNNLGKRLLERGAVAFVGSTRTAFGAGGWDDPSDGNCSTMDWLFTDKAARTDGARSSVGWSHQHALQDMYNFYNWDTSWWQFFEWNIYSNPDLWLRERPTALPNLDNFYRPGWTYPIVPRSAAGATSTWCPVTGTLPGNTSDTYFNWTWENNGSSNSPAAKTRIFVDERWMGYTKPSLAAGSSSYHYNWDYGPNITGGRHSLYYRLDEDEEVWETSESDNFWGHQFVWSPYALLDDTPIYRASPPHKDAWVSPYWYNNDGFSFHVGQAHPNKWWSAVGILPSNSAADYDLRLWDIGDYSGSEQGFGSASLEWSSGGAGISEFVIVNDNTAADGTYYAGAINYNNETGNYHIEEATSTKVYPGTNGPYSMSATSVLDIYETNEDTINGISAGDWGFRLEQTSGSCDLGMSLYDDETVHAKKSEYLAGGYANSNGDGADEFMRVTIPDVGYHGLVVWKADSSDYSKSSTYTIKMGKCATPGALSGPSPADGATDVSINADLNWADSSDTEYYEVWLKEGSGAWEYLGDSESSFWALGTLNEATNYQWFIRAHNICGSTVQVYWDFTTEDNTPPMPNLMTWATEPYETSTSSISMVATTATDPTTPITYLFDFYNSPTGGLGGSDSSWQTSTSFTDSGLSVNHQYGYRVMAQDGSGNSTAYSSISYDFTDIEASNGVVFGTITNSSIQVRSSNTPSNLTLGSSGLRIDTTGSTSGWKQDNNFWTNASLTPNTKHEYKVLTRNGDANITVWSPTSSRYTLANIPVAAAFSNVTQTSIRANWSSNGNPAGTAYLCQNTTTGTDSGWTKNSYWNNTGLACGTTYSYLVRARNHEGVETGLVNLGSQATLDCSSPPCPGDFDNDGDVDDDDLAILAGNFGRNSCSACDGDFDGDGDVDGVDLAQFLTVYGHPCP